MATTAEISKVFREIAALLELKGENSFRIRAFTNAARVLKMTELGTEEFIENLRKGAIKGFGHQLTDFALTFHDTGSLPYLAELRAEFPSGVLELLNLPGLGAKKVKTLYQDLGISGIEQLREACEKNTLSTVKGFGKKTEQNILQAVTQYKSYQGLLRYDTAVRIAEQVLVYLEKTPLCERAEIAGSLRRRKEVVEDLTVLAASSRPSELIRIFLDYAEIVSVIQEEEQRVSVRLDSNALVHLKVVDESEFPVALLFYTGSREHNAALGKLAEERGFVLEDKRLVRGTEPQPVATETDLYSALHLSFIPPEQRENQGEADIAALAFSKGENYPALIEESDTRGIIHVHTTYSDGTNTLPEWAQAVKDLGYDYLGISDHSQSATYAGGLKPDDIKRQHEEIDLLNESLAPFRIFKGIESDILPDGSLDYTETVLESFDFIVVSVHSKFTMNRKEMTDRIVRAMSSPYTTILGHPTGRLLLQREPYPVDLEAVLQAAADYDVAVELNANPKRLDLDWRYHQRAKELGLIIPICPDAHSVQTLSDLTYGINIARKGGLTTREVLTCWDTQAVDAFFNTRKKPSDVR